jgi:hypothetical protein
MCKRKPQEPVHPNHVGRSDKFRSDVDERCGDDLVDNESIAGYLARAAAELESIARSSKLRLVAHFFAMASEEAESQTRRVESRATLH